MGSLGPARVSTPPRLVANTNRLQGRARPALRLYLFSFVSFPLSFLLSFPLSLFYLADYGGKPHKDGMVARGLLRVTPDMDKIRENGKT